MLKKRNLSPSVRVLLGLVLWLARGNWSYCEEQAKQPEPKYLAPAIIQFDGMITPLTEQYVYRKLAMAERHGADLVILDIDSPGGTIDSSLAIARRMRDLDWADTVAWVPRQALSGAAIVALGCGTIVMQPNAVLGDAGPIMEDEFRMYQNVPEKVKSHLVREVRDLASSRHRPPALAEAMVDVDMLVFQTTNRQTGEVRFMSEAEIASDGGEAVWEKGPLVLESGESRLLEVNGLRAVELGLAEANAEDREALKGVLGYSVAPWELKPSGVDTTALILNLPLVTGLLFVVGLVALYVELSAPGISVGGLISFLCFALYFWSRFLGGTAEVLEVLLFIAGIVFLLVELFVLPGFGVAGFMGLVLMLVGIVMASQDFIIPTTQWQFDRLINSLTVVAVSGVVVVGAVMTLSRHFGTLPLFSGLVLQPSESASVHSDTKQQADDKLPPQTPRVAIDVGDWGIAESPLRPAGKAKFGDDRVDVITDGEFVARGRQIRVLEIRGNEIVVCDVEPDIS